MKARRLLRRASVLAPNVTVRSRLPWPVTVLLIAVVIGLAAAAALWAFEEGRRLTGPHDGDLRAMNRELTAKLATVQAERDKLAAAAGTAESRVGMAEGAQTQMAEQLKALEAENAQLKEDLAFFDSLLPAPTNSAGIYVRSFRIAPDEAQPTRMHFRVLLMQGGGKAFAPVSEFEGQLALTLNVVQAGKPATIDFPGAVAATAASAPASTAATRVKLTHYQRLEGWVDVPPGTTVKSVAVKVLQNGKIKASQSFSI
ncbi:DNA-binding protein [Ralstonia insidiosa]|uniref:DNA-binding protein n=1 Tax=Ralstonia insidiosa TaxID=190721 RepID=A0A191ZTB1_9RALS|nr:DUF6776 family protein [Ralstonia insidiosa]ANJ71365.1 DNA-binding protein [Ralstonia insidiosa]KAB0471953.1 DNA-binding protein [Ralstonia insidiosa]MBY4908477.1 DNA-binding protein [Ralstonia insidiosa]